MIWFVWESQSWKSASCSLLRRTKHPIALNDHPHGIILNHHTGHFFSTFIKQTWKSRPNEIWIYRRFITMSQWLLSFIVDDEKPMKCKHCTLASNLLSIQWLASWEGVEIDSRVLVIILLIKNNIIDRSVSCNGDTTVVYHVYTSQRNWLLISTPKPKALV